MFRVASFDIGKKNFAFLVEESIREPIRPINLTYSKDGTPTPSTQSVLDRVARNGRVVLHKNSSITAGCYPSTTEFDHKLYHNMQKLLDSYMHVWDTCDVFVIEEQMQFGKGKSNPMATKLGHFCEAYFRIVYGDTKQVVCFHSYNKTQVLGAPKVWKPGKKTKGRYVSLDYKTRKAWAVTTAEKILTNRGESIEALTSASKKDDLADVLVQAVAFRVLLFHQGKVN